MDTDLALAIGITLATFSIPSIWSAWVDRRPPWVMGTAWIIGIGLILYAVLVHPEGYTLEQVPSVFVEIIARYIL